MSISGQNIVDSARTISDLRASRFYLDNPHLIGFVNDILKELYDLLCVTREGYFQSSVPVTLVSNSATVPSDFYKELGLASGTAPNQTPIEPLKSFSERLTHAGYWLAGRTLTIYPLNVAPPSPVTLDYIPDAVRLTLATFLPTDLERFSEFIANGTAIKIRQGRNQDASDKIARQLELRARVIEMATARKAGPRIPPIPAQEYSYRRGRIGYPYGT